MTSVKCDVVVVGAGLSGLTAANAILEKDSSLSVIVLEAKDRVGGRTLTRQLHGSDSNLDFWDVGGEWVGRPYPHLQYLLEKFDIDTFSLRKSEVETAPLSLLPALDIYVLSLRLRRRKKYFDKLACQMKSSVQAFECDGIIFEDYCNSRLWTQEARRTVEAACKSMFGLKPSEMSLLYFLMNVSSAGGFLTFRHPELCSGQERRIKGGAQQLCHRLAQVVGKNGIVKNQPVTHINQTADKVTVLTADKSQYRCSRVIMAVPPHLLADIHFTPELPSNKMDVLRNIPLAHIVKFVYSYEERFWSNKGSESHGLQVVLEDPADGPVGIAYDGTSSRNNPAIVGFVSSTKAPFYAQELQLPHPWTQEQELRRQNEAILSVLEDVMGPEVHDYIDSTFIDWSTEKYNGGCFLKSIVPGTTRHLYQTLREPFENVHFAGTETGTVWCGLMNGAVQSGLRAGAEVLLHLRPELLDSEDPDKAHLFTNYNITSGSGGYSVGVCVAFGVMGVTVGVVGMCLTKQTLYAPLDIFRRLYDIFL
ncbi:probable flavin-containing monoamine oxidase A [Ylistrum balloti]|uniref:probable flavin-containing monoamine oxidase A n=1 Tax=Ylistrum balloti TaxID=509963 RepID=UPI0029059D4A|nr:probable flavin-containing monoamine oxidase A [Ylistrum balloti]